MLFKYQPNRSLLMTALLILVLSTALACGLPVTIVPATGTPALTTAAPLPSETSPAALPTAIATDAAQPTVPAPTPTHKPQPTGATVSQVQIFLVALEGGSTGNLPIGCGDQLVAITRPVAPTTQPIPAALAQLFAIKEQHYGQSGLYNALWQSNLRVDSASVDSNGAATVVLTGQYALGGECDTPRFKGQIEQTILAVPGVKATRIILNGKPIDQALSLK